MANEFSHLHLHTEYSLLDGNCNINELIKNVKLLGQKSVAITDNMNMYGTINFYKTCLKEGIKPIIGCEINYFFDNEVQKGSSNNNIYSLVLLCKDIFGYYNLIKIVSNGKYISGIKAVPFSIIEKYNKGLICLSGYKNSIFIKHIKLDKNSQFMMYLNIFKDIFKKDFYIEIQNQNLEWQCDVNELLYLSSKSEDIETIATNNVHYINKSDSYIQKILYCIKNNKKDFEVEISNLENSEFYLKSYDDMALNFNNFKGAIENSVNISNKCNLIIEFGNIKIPNFISKYNIDNKSLLRKISYKGINKRYKERLEEKIIERLKYELKIIFAMGYESYFLIVYDFVKYAKKNGINVGPGRGSGAGSLVAYCIGITDVDPIKYDLIFERFLNPERASMPDFDIDFCYEKRQQVIDYVVKKYGFYNVANIITFGTMGAKGAIRDIGRVRNIDLSYINKINQSIPKILNISISQALEMSKDLKDMYENDIECRRLVDMSKKIEGVPRHTSRHAAGIIICDKKVEEYGPVDVEDSLILQYDMKQLELLGMLKIDFLGLKNLTVIKKSEKIINSKDKTFIMSNISYDDKKTYELLSKGNTIGVFQLESRGVRNILQNMQINNIEDIATAISLYRPGPIESGSVDEYLKNRKNPKNIKYIHESLRSILEETYGCFIYQEQVMKACRDIAGYSYGRADLVRRYMSKKDKAFMKKEKDIFIFGKDTEGNKICEGAINNGIEYILACQIFDIMVHFASYGFNKSHAVSYSMIAYQTAYLKANFPVEYICSLINTYIENTEKVIESIKEAVNMGIKIYPVDINISESYFKIYKKGLSVGFLFIKNIGKKFCDDIVNIRNDIGLFSDFYSFCKAVCEKDGYKRAIIYLIKSGCFENLGINKKTLLYNFDKIIEKVYFDNIDISSGQTSMVKEMDNSLEINYLWKYLEDSTIEETISIEEEVFGFPISVSYIKDWYKIVDNQKIYNLDYLHINRDSVLSENNSKKILFYLFSYRKIYIKNKPSMHYIEISDGKIFEEVFLSDIIGEKYNKYFKRGKLFIGDIFLKKDDINYKYFLKNLSTLDDYFRNKSF
ncbi:MAG: DNA polymerase III subunit alpha [Oscillospiraceae bacterium]|nr:DNA polymerase III subunit alpha [Oscillospiraceae bacterium]